MQVALVLYLAGAISADIPYTLQEDVEDLGVEIKYTIRGVDNSVKKVASINGKCANILRKYMKCRPSSTTRKHFLLFYRNGECRNSPMGRERVHRIPNEMAKFLNMPQDESYTFRSCSGLSSKDIVEYRKCSEDTKCDVTKQTMEVTKHLNSQMLSETESLNRRRKTFSTVEETAMPLKKRKTVNIVRETAMPLTSSTISNIANAARKFAVNSTTANHPIIDSGDYNGTIWCRFIKTEN